MCDSKTCNVIPNWKNLKKRLSRWRDPESQKRTKGKRDAKANFTYDTQLAFSTLNKDTKTEENTSNEDASIRDRNRRSNTDRAFKRIPSHPQWLL